MKKLFFIFLLLCGLTGVSASEHGTLRVNFHTHATAKWSSPSGFKGGSGKYKDARGVPFYELLLRKDLDSIKWTPVEVIIVPAKSEKAFLELMVYSHPRRPWIRLRNLKISGTTLRNTEFKLDRSGRAASWSCAPLNFKGAAPGEVRVSYHQKIRQAIELKAAVPVKLSFEVRLEKLQKYELPAQKLPAGKAPAFVLVGDSTVCSYHDRHRPLAGWGEKLQLQAGAALKNAARGGESTKSFIASRRWYDVVCALRDKDILFIQFGHNEQGGSRNIWSTTIPEYKANLKKIVTEARSRGAHPVLVTPVCRRIFREEMAVNTLADRAVAMKEVAKELKTDLIDLNKATFELLENSGSEGSKKFYNHLKPGEHKNYPGGRRDDSHFNVRGAEAVAALAAAEIRKKQLPFARFVKPSALPRFASAAKLPPPHRMKLRIDLVSPTQGSFDLSCGLTKEQQFTRDRNNKLQSYSILYRSLENEKWNWVSFSFFPAKTENLRIRLLASPVPKNTEGWLLVDDIRVSSGSLKNPDFEEFDVNCRGFAHWKGVQGVTAAWQEGLAWKGNFCAKINYRNYLEQTIPVTAGKQITVTLRVRPLKLAKLNAAADENWVMDPDTGAAVLISKGLLTFRPTFENCGIYINRKKAHYGKKLKCRFLYRERKSSRWLTAIEPSEIPRENSWRGSLLGLRENTLYDVKIEFLENGKVIDTLSGYFRTRNSQVPIAQTIVLDPAKIQSMTRFKSGTPRGYIRYTMKKGGVIKGSRSNFEAVLNVSNARYVIFEGLKIDANQARSALKLENCDFIQVKNCEFFNFGRSDWVRDYRMKGVWTYKGRATGWDGGIRLENSGDILIERCLIRDPHSSANAWFYSHPTGPEAIFLSASKGGVVLRYNDFIGSDKKRWNDVVESSGNFDVNGGLMRDSDVYGNIFAFANDDGIELEGGAMNQRCYLNFFDRCFSGVSTGNTMLGPSYVYRNLFGMMGDENGQSFSPLKNGGSGPSYGTVYLLNNSIAFPVQNAMGGIGSKPDKSLPLKMAVSGNIFRARRLIHPRDFVKWNTFSDGNMIEIPGDKKFREQAAGKGFEKNSLWMQIPYADAEKGDYSLKTAFRTPANLLQLPLPGALQKDKITSLPYRPVDFEIFPKRIFFKSHREPLSGSFTLEAGKGFSGSYSVYCNDDFFTVTPASGTVKPGTKVRFTVKLAPGKMIYPRLYNGLVLVRFADGFSRAVSLQADFRSCEKRIARAEKNAITLPLKGMSGNGTFSQEVIIPEAGCYFVFFKGDFTGDSVCDMQIGTVKTNRKRARLIGSGPFRTKGRYACLYNGGGGLSGWYFHLEKGRQKLVFKPGLRASDKLEKLYLTRKPELFLGR